MRTSRLRPDYRLRRAAQRTSGRDDHEVKNWTCVCLFWFIVLWNLLLLFQRNPAWYFTCLWLLFRLNTEWRRDWKAITWVFDFRVELRQIPVFTDTKGQRGRSSSGPLPPPAVGSTWHTFPKPYLQSHTLSAQISLRSTARAASSVTHRDTAAATRGERFNSPCSFVDEWGRNCYLPTNKTSHYVVHLERWTPPGSSSWSPPLNSYIISVFFDNSSWQDPLYAGVDCDSSSLHWHEYMSLFGFYKRQSNDNHTNSQCNAIGGPYVGQRAEHGTRRVRFLITTEPDVSRGRHLKGEGSLPNLKQGTGMWVKGWSRALAVKRLQRKTPSNKKGHRFNSHCVLMLRQQLDWTSAETWGRI